MLEDLSPEFDEARIWRFAEYLRTGPLCGTELYPSFGDPARLCVLVEKSCFEDDPDVIAHLKCLLHAADANVYFYRYVADQSGGYWAAYRATTEWSRTVWIAPDIRLDRAACEQLSMTPCSQFTLETSPSIPGGSARLDAVAAAYFASTLSSPIVVRTRSMAKTRHLDFGTRFVSPREALPIIAHYCRMAKGIYWPTGSFTWLDDRLGPLEFYRAVLATNAPELPQLIDVSMALSAKLLDSSILQLATSVMTRLARGLREFDELLADVSAPNDRVGRTRYGHTMRPRESLWAKRLPIEACLDGILFNLMGALDALTGLYVRVVLLPSNCVQRSEVARTPSIYDGNFLSEYVRDVIESPNVDILVGLRHLIERVAKLRNSVHGAALRVASAGSKMRGMRDNWEKIPWFAQTEWVVHLDAFSEDLRGKPRNDVASWGIWDARFSFTEYSNFDPAFVEKMERMREAPISEISKQYDASPTVLSGDVATIAYRVIEVVLGFARGLGKVLLEDRPNNGVNLLLGVNRCGSKTDDHPELELIKNQIKLLYFSSLVP